MDTLKLSVTAPAVQNEADATPVASTLTTKAPKKGLKSSKVVNRVLFPYANTMIIEREYTFLENNSEASVSRPRVNLPKDTRNGWEFIGSSKDDYKFIGNNGVWVVREHYIRKGHVFQYPKLKTMKQKIMNSLADENSEDFVPEDAE